MRQDLRGTHETRRLILAGSTALESGSRKPTGQGLKNRWPEAQSPGRRQSSGRHEGV